MRPPEDTSLLAKLLAENGQTMADFQNEYEKYSQSEAGGTFKPKQAVLHTPELDRILSLPRRRWEDRAEILSHKITEYMRAPGGTMKLRPIQAAALADIHDYKGGLLPIRVGGGKTLISLLSFTVLAARRPILLLPAKLIGKTEQEEPQLRKHWLIPGHVRKISYELLGREQHAKLLEESAPDVIFADECFVTGTLVRTEKGLRPIESLVAGDSVVSHDGTAVEVEHAWASIPHDLITITVEEEKIVCTPNHPFLTQRGWVRAEEVTTKDALVCVVQDHARQEEEVPLLRSVVQRELENVATGDPCEGAHARGRGEDLQGEVRVPLDAPRSPQVLLGQDETRQPDAEPGDTGGRESRAASNRAQAEDSRRERRSYAGAAAGASDRAGRGLGGGGSLSCGKSSTERRVGPCVDSGHLQSSNEDDRGGGRGVARLLLGEGPGFEEGLVLREHRLARVAGVERGRARTDAGDRLVHNLQVGGSHTYAVGRVGAVVHNCHKLKNTSAAVTRRVKRYMEAHPSTIFIGASGTITKRSIHDFAHLSAWALKRLNPTPAIFVDRMAWSMVLDEMSDSDARLAPGALILLCNDEEKKIYQEDSVRAVRLAFRRRVTETPGVVASQDGQLGVSLRIESVSPTVKGIDMALASLRNDWERPDGEPILDAIELWRHLREVGGAGFYYRWNPSPPPEWLEARRTWAKACREILRHNRIGLDSESHVARALDEGLYNHVPAANTALNDWRGIKNTFVPQTEAVWLTQDVVNFCVDWMKKEAGIVWVEHVELGYAIAHKSGVSFYQRGGVDQRGRPIEQHPIGTPLIASVASNHEGRNLQAWSKNLITSPPTTGTIWEQMLGRTHRDGQQADEVVATLMIVIQEQALAFEKARRDAKYQTEMTGQEQKLSYADITVTPSHDVRR